MSTSQRPAVRLEILPADEGDCLLLSLHAEDGHVRHVLVDAGTAATSPRLAARLAELDVHHIELAVVTHVDVDHIAGMVGLLESPGHPSIGDLWFNGFKHLPALPARRGIRHGIRLDGLIEAAGVPWNRAFGGGAVVRDDDDARTGALLSELPRVRTDWGLEITLLSPTKRRLLALAREWHTAVDELEAARRVAVRSRGAGAHRLTLEQLAVAKTPLDAAVANGSSIALMLSYRERRLLLAGDAFATVLYPALGHMAKNDGSGRDSPGASAPLEVDVFKLPHHGSSANLPARLLSVVRARHYVVSTNGRKFAHPDAEAMARVICHGRPGTGPATLWFNYATPENARWRAGELAARYDFMAKGAIEGGMPGATIDL
jgi:beta-lactamase superfamily II metal-dependent hydrolase